MESNYENIQIDKLDRIVTVRMTEKDYQTLQGISENKKSDVSKTIRAIIGTVIEMVRENNRKK